MSLPPPPAAGTPMLPADTFAGQVVLIAGAGSVLLAAAAAEFARCGGRIAQLHRPHDEVLTEAEVALPCDLSDPRAIAAAFDAVERKSGAVNVLLNAGVNDTAIPAENLTVERWRASQAASDAAFLCAGEFARRRRNTGGAILNLLDTSAFAGGPGVAGTAAASGALLTLTKTLAVEWASFGIRVNAIAAGPFDGDDTQAHRQAQREGRDLARTLPAHRLGQPQEFGWAATLLCSPYSAYTTGATFIIDGGNHLRRGITGPRFRPVAAWAGTE